MAAISVQLQPDRSPTLDIPSVVALLLSLDASARVSDGEDGGRYVSINYVRVDAKAVWREIRGQLAKEQALARAAIVVCEGRHGWDDYLLLHHYDQTLIVDEI